MERAKGMDEELKKLGTDIETKRLSLSEDKLSEMQKQIAEKRINMQRYAQDAERESGEARDAFNEALVGRRSHDPEQVWPWQRNRLVVASPVIRDGDVIGVVSAHTEAPREFSPDEVDFVVTAASLVAGAIENARLYGEMQRRVHELEALTELAEAIARTEALEELLPAVADGARRLLVPLVAVMFLATVWFVYLQAFVIRAYCVYCLLSAAVTTNCRSVYPGAMMRTV